MPKRKPTGYYDEEVYADVLAGILEIDSQGCVWKVKRIQGSAWGHDSYLVDCVRHRAEDLKVTAKPYLDIAINCRNGRSISSKAHRIVWRHFNGPIPKGLTVNHKNGIKKDNHPDNLELMTRGEQMLHSVHVLGNKHCTLGEAHPGAKLNNKKVREIRTTKIGCAELSKKFNVSKDTIYRIRRREIWTHVE